jgi:hypothetical protein
MLFMYQNQYINYRVKNHDFTPKNLIFSNFRGGVRQVRRPCDRRDLQTVVSVG